MVLVLLLAGCGESGSERGRTSTTTTSTAVTAAAPTTDPTLATIPRVDPATLDCPVSVEEARTSLDAAVAFLRSMATPRIDATWVLTEVADRHAELGIEDPLDGRVLAEPNDPARRLIDPDVEPGIRDPDPRGPARRLNADAALAFAPRTAENLARLDRFTARTDLTGYALTHQWLAILWATQVGWRLPERILDRSEGLQRRILAEVGGAGETQDLWAERVGLLATFGTIPLSVEDQDAWRCRAVRTQGPDGWRDDGAYVQRYDGGAFAVTAGPEHVAAGVALVLGGLVPAG